MQAKRGATQRRRARGSTHLIQWREHAQEADSCSSEEATGHHGFDVHGCSLQRATEHEDDAADENGESTSIAIGELASKEHREECSEQ